MKYKNKYSLRLFNLLLVVFLTISNYSTSSAQPQKEEDTSEALIVGFNKTTPANGSSISMPADTYYLLQWTDALIPDTDAYQYCIDTTNNNTCNTSWMTRPNLYSGGPNDFVLEYGKTYYWQVKVRDADVYANGGGNWWSFTINNTPPAFGKTTPLNTAVIPMPASSYYLLQWTDLFLPETDRYQYCIDTTNNNSCDGNAWVTRNSLYSGGVGDITLEYGKTYFWQVKARDAGTQADGGAWWSFTISNTPPTFGKITPANGAVIPMPTDTYYLLQWSDLFLPDTDRYQYCIDTSNNNSCDTSWLTRPNLYSGGPNDFTLEYGKTYYWQVKARDAGTQADSGTWWSFTISNTPPTFEKTTPTNGTVFTHPPDTYYLLQWTDLFLPASDRYQYCVDETNNNACDTTWITRPNLYSGGPNEFEIKYGRTYYWQVKARDAGTLANGGGNWWSFSVSPLAAAPNVLSIVRASPNGTNAASVDFTVTFDQSVTGVDITDFELNPTIVDASITAISGSGATYTVTVNTGTISGTIRLNFLDDDSVQNNQSSPVGGVGLGNGFYDIGEIYTITKP